MELWERLSTEKRSYQWSILWAFRVNIKETYELDVSAGSFWYNRQLFFGSSFLSQRSKWHNNDNAIINARSDTVSLRCIILCCFIIQSALSANSEALATVTGIVDGTGSVGAAIGQVRMTLGCWLNCRFRSKRVWTNSELTVIQNLLKLLVPVY